MDTISEIVNKAIAIGYLSNRAIQDLRDLLKIGYYEEDVDALMQLHHAVVTGLVQQKSGQNKPPSVKKNHRGIVKMKLVCQTTFAAVIVGTIVFAMPKTQQSVLSNEITTMDIWQQ